MNMQSKTLLNISHSSFFALILCVNGCSQELNNLAAGPYQATGPLPDMVLLLSYLTLDYNHLHTESERKNLND